MSAAVWETMGASAAWDGRIDVEEYVERFRFNDGTLDGRIIMKGFSEDVAYRLIEKMERAYSDVKSGRSAIGAFAMPIDLDASNS